MSINPEYPWLELYLQAPNAPEPFKCEWRRIRRDLDCLRGRGETSSALLAALTERHREDYAAAGTYAELCEVSKEYKRMREEWAQASEDAWQANLHRVLPKLRTD